MLGPGVGGLELVVIALAALIIIGPKDLPMLMRKVGQFLGRARRMAAEFRASFDEMARQSELDELRREVEALRQGQMTAIDADTKAALSDIDRELRASPTVKAVTQTPPMTEPAAAAPQEAAPETPAPVAKPAAKPRAPRRKTSQ